MNRIFAFVIISFFFLNTILGQNDPYKWDRLPSNSEINTAVKDLKNQLNKTISVNGNVVDNQTPRLSEPIKFHDKRRAGTLPPQDISRMIIYVEVTGIMGSSINEYNLFQNQGKFRFAKHASVEPGKSLSEKYNEFIAYLSSYPNNDSGLARGFAPSLSNKTSNGNTSSNSDYNPDSTEDDSEGLWKVVIGAAAVIAAILAFRKRLKKSQKKNKKVKQEKYKYILQLSDESFTLSENKPQFLYIQAWKITEKGKFPTNASIHIQNSEKALSILPFTGTGRLKSQLLLKDQPAKEDFNITVIATIEGRSIQKSVTIHTGGENQLVIKTSPDNTRSLRPNIDQTLTCYAQVIGPNDKPIEELTKKIKFNPNQSKWIDLSEPIIDDGWIAINVGASDPDGEYDVTHPPKSVTLGITMDDVPEGESILQNNLEIQLLDCMLETNLEDTTFPVSEEKSEVTCKAYIENCDGKIPWKFKAIYMKDYETPDSEPLTEIEIEEVSETKVNITLTGPIVEPKEGEKYVRKLFVISAQQKEEKPLERHIYVMVSKEGLFIEKGVTKNNEIAFLAKGDFKDELEFSLNCYNPETDQMEVDKKALQNLSFELISDEKAEKNINTVLQPNFFFDKFVTTMHHAYYQFEVPNKFPGYGDIYELPYLVKAPVTNTENPNAFEKIITLKVQSYGMGDKFPEWEKAYRDCKTTIYDFFLDSQERNKLLDMLERNKDKFDIEGMVAFRKKIWMVAHDLMINEAQRYISEANSYDAIIDTLEWVVWMGDIAFQVVVSTYLGPFTGFGASTFKEIALTGYKMVIEGKSVDEFVDAQIASFKEVLFSVAKGGVINTRNIGKIYKGNKIKVWAIYAVATFYISYLRTDSIPEAAKMTARQLRDEAIIVFLNKHVQKGQARLKAENEKKIETKKNLKEKSKPNEKSITQGKNDYESAKGPPDVSGYTKRSMVAIQKIANKNKVQIITRPTNAAAKRLLKSGQAVPKKQFVKNKTISDLDTYLGASKKNIGKVGSFKPTLNKGQLNKMPKAQVKKIVKRYKQRRREWNNQKEHIKASIKRGEIIVKDGLIFDKKTGLPFTGDIDIFDIRGPNGEKLSRAMYEKVVKELIKSNITNVEHGAHLWWQRWKGGNIKDIRTGEGIFDAIAGGHSMGGEALVKFGSSPNINAKPKSIYYKGRTDVKNL